MRAYVGCMDFVSIAIGVVTFVALLALIFFLERV
jgi:hypothetical protein